MRFGENLRQNVSFKIYTAVVKFRHDLGFGSLDAAGAMGCIQTCSLLMLNISLA